MARRFEKKLNAAHIKALKTPGKYEDGGGLRLIIDASGAKRWVMRVSVKGQGRVERGLGSYPMVSIEEARDKAVTWRKAARSGIDLRQQERLSAARAVTFRAAFERFFADKRKELGNAKHLWQWEATMESYVFPSIGDRPVAEITASEVVDVLRPIWNVKSETARRTLQRMKLVFDAAIVLQQREKANPCTGVTAVLGARNQKVRHLASLPWQEVPAFIVTLRSPSRRRHPLILLAFELLILTAARSGEVRNMQWCEVDLDTGLWTVPEERMKARRAHVVPLAPPCIEILRSARAIAPNSARVFPSRSQEGTISDMAFTQLIRTEWGGGSAAIPTPHGFRSSFKVWCAEAGVRDEISEAALAHSDRNKVRAAYRRTDFLDERRGVMREWATHCQSKVIQCSGGQ